MPGSDFAGIEASVVVEGWMTTTADLMALFYSRFMTFTTFGIMVIPTFAVNQNCKNTKGTPSNFLAGLQSAFLIIT